MLTSILGLVFAASVSVSVVQAADMAAKMTMTAAMGVATSDAKCPDCDHSGKNATGMDCRLTACTTAGVATLASALDVAIEHYERDLRFLHSRRSPAGRTRPIPTHPDASTLS